MPKRRGAPPSATSYNKHSAEGQKPPISVSARSIESSSRAPILARVRELENGIQCDIFHFNEVMPETLYTTRDLARLFGKANVTITKECREAGIARRGHAYLLTQTQSEEILRRFEDKDRRRKEQRQLVKKQEESALSLVIFKKVGMLEHAVRQLVQDRESYYKVFWEYINAQEDFRERVEERWKHDFNYRSEVRHKIGELQTRIEDSVKEE